MDVFVANQMASQAYRMKVTQIKEFCRIKSLDYGVKAKLLAFYDHLFPEDVIGPIAPMSPRHAFIKQSKGV